MIDPLTAVPLVQVGSAVRELRDAIAHDVVEPPGTKSEYVLIVEVHCAADIVGTIPAQAHDVKLPNALRIDRPLNL